MSYKFIDEKKEHLHTFDGKPLIGTTSVVDVLSKPLSYWASGEAVKTLGWLHPKFTKEQERIDNAGKTLEELKGLTVEQYLDKLDYAYKAHAISKDKAADDGTDLHARAEEYIKALIGKEPLEADKKILKLAKWIETKVSSILWSEAHHFSTEMWVGGISDFCFKDKEGKIGLMDFKSAKDVYLSHRIQLGGYAIQISENGSFDKDGNQTYEPINVDYVSVWPFGKDPDEPVIDYRIDVLKEGFLSALNIYKLKQTYESN